MHLTETSAADSDTVSVMRHATIWMWADSIEEKVEFTLWLNAWKKRVLHISSDYGGAGLHLFDVIGPNEAIAALPECLLASPKRKVGGDWPEQIVES